MCFDEGWSTPVLVNCASDLEHDMPEAGRRVDISGPADYAALGG